MNSSSPVLRGAAGTGPASSTRCYAVGRSRKHVQAAVVLQGAPVRHRTTIRQPWQDESVDLASLGPSEASVVSEVAAPFSSDVVEQLEALMLDTKGLETCVKDVNGAAVQVLLDSARSERAILTGMRGASHVALHASTSSNTGLPAPASTRRSGRREWGPEVNSQFLAAVETLGGPRVATSRAVHRLMGSPTGITRRQVQERLAQQLRRTQKGATPSGVPGAQASASAAKPPALDRDQGLRSQRRLGAASIASAKVTGAITVIKGGDATLGSSGGGAHAEGLAAAVSGHVVAAAAATAGPVVLGAAAARKTVAAAGATSPAPWPLPPATAGAASAAAPASAVQRRRAAAAAAAAAAAEAPAASAAGAELAMSGPQLLPPGQPVSPRSTGRQLASARQRRTKPGIPAPASTAAGASTSSSSSSSGGGNESGRGAAEGAAAAGAAPRPRGRPPSEASRNGLYGTDGAMKGLLATRFHGDGCDTPGLLGRQEEALLVLAAQQYLRIDAMRKQVSQALQREATDEEVAAAAKLPSGAQVAEAWRLGLQAMRTLLHSNSRLVGSTITRNRHMFGFRLVPLPDLLDEGLLGLVHAISKFDASKGYRLSTYSYWWIINYAQKAVQRQLSMVGVPTQWVELFPRCSHATKVLQEQLGRKPTPRELAQHIGKPRQEKAITQMLETMPLALQSISLDAAVQRMSQHEERDGLSAVSVQSLDGGEGGSMVGGPEALEAMSLSKDLALLVQPLPENERKALLDTFGLQMEEPESPGGFASLAYVGVPLDRRRGGHKKTKLLQQQQQQQQPAGAAAAAAAATTAAADGDDAPDTGSTSRGRRQRMLPPRHDRHKPLYLMHKGLRQLRAERGRSQVIEELSEWRNSDAIVGGRSSMGVGRKS